MASDDDEIARLLREVDAVTGGESGSLQDADEKTSRSGREVAKNEDSKSTGSKRGRWILVAAVGGGGAGLITGTLFAILPFVDGISTAIGAAGGAAIAAAVGRPPRWLG